MVSDPIDIDAARAAYRRRQQERAEARYRRWERAREEADTVVQMIVDTYRPERVVIWGSLLRPERFAEYSDIDIAVQGITDVETWAALERDALGIATLPLDLVPLDSIHPEHCTQILRRGKIVYERIP